jgi:hypothetical protein
MPPAPTGRALRCRALRRWLLEPNRSNTIEVNLVGGDERPAAERIDFIGSVKWRDEQPFARRDGTALAAKLLSVPGASTSTKLVGVSRRGFKRESGLDIEIGPEEIIAAYGAPPTPS